jgi:hypothetical protein
MADRRSLGDALALNPEKLAFIHGGPVAPEEGRGPAPQALEEPPAPAAPLPREPRARIKRRDRPRNRAPEVAVPASVVPVYANSTDFPPILVSLTTRLSPPTAEALRRATLEQKLRRRRPHTQQEIVEAAVKTWLEANGFLGTVG